MSSRSQRQYAYRALALLSLCALTSSPIARANDCDTPAAESCACQSTVASASPKAKGRSAQRAEAGSKQKKSAQAPAPKPQALAHRPR
jgi:hypothetical protein